MNSTEQTAGREPKKDNDLFFTCSLIEFIARRTKNRRCDVVEKLGKARIARIYELADVYHSDNIDDVCEEFICEAEITEGDFDNVSECRYALPSCWDIGKVYKRLILGISRECGMDIRMHCRKHTIPLSAGKLMIITAAFIMMPRRIF